MATLVELPRRRGSGSLDGESAGSKALSHNPGVPRDFVLLTGTYRGPYGEM